MAIMEPQVLQEQQIVTSATPSTFNVDVVVLEEPTGPIPVLSLPEGEVLPPGVSLTPVSITIPPGAFLVTLQLQGPWLFLDPALTNASDQLAQMGVAPDSTRKTVDLGLKNQIPSGMMKQTSGFNLWFQHEETSLQLRHDPSIVFEPPT